MAKRIFMILIRANTERQIPVIRATLVSAPPSECLEIRLCREDPEDINRAKKRRQKKGRLGNTFIPTLIVFSAIICKLALGKTVGGLVENNRIEKGSLTPLLQNGLSEEEVFKRQIDGEIFRAYKCQRKACQPLNFP